MANFTFAEETTAPGAPSSGNVVMYAKTDGKMYSKDDAGTESAVSGALPAAGGTMTGDITMTAASLIEAEGAAVTAASSTNIWATDGNTVHVTGNTGIADFATAPQAGAWMKVIFDGTPLLTQSANLNLNAGGANIQIAAGDFAMVYADTTTQMDVFVITKAGTAVVSSGGITLGTPVASTSGTSITFTGIPAGTKRVSINLTGVSTNGTSIIIFQIGPSGGVETSGYLSSAMGANTGGVAPSTAQTIGFTTSQQNATACLWRGTMVFTLENSSTNTWTAFGVFDASGTQLTMCCAGAKSLAGALSQIAMTTVNGSDAFDAGEVNITYE